MSESCNHECSGCSKDCAERDNTEKLNDKSSVKKVIGIVSGKGGVGKSLVTSMMAVAMNNRGKKTAILDADITGPSIPKSLGITDKAYDDGEEIRAVESGKGIKVMSTNLLLENDTDPVIWRGPLIAGAVKQFWTDVVWGDVDYMFIDMPPGTGDVPLTVFQSLPVDGIIVVTSPQELVSMIVEKAVNMAEAMNIPVVGLVENMSYFRCPDNGRDYNIFGKSRIEEVAAEHGLKVLAKLPIDPAIAEACDRGTIEEYDCSGLNAAAEELEKLEERK